MRWIKQIPNILTLVNLGIGLIAISLLFQNHITLVLGEEVGYFAGDVDVKQLAYGLLPISCILIIAAAIFDFADGAAARILNASSALGAQLDSLSDLVSFGVAPALIARELFLVSALGQDYAMELPLLITWIPFLSCLAGAYRLARFNVETGSNGKAGFFQGMPIPFYGILIACLGIGFVINEQFAKWILSTPYYIGAFIIIGSYLLQSRVPFLSMKFSKADKYNVFRIILLLVIIITLVIGHFLGLGLFSSVIITLPLYLIISIIAFKYSS